MDSNVIVCSPCCNKLFSVILAWAASSLTRREDVEIVQRRQCDQVLLRVPGHLGNLATEFRVVERNRGKSSVRALR